MPSRTQNLIQSTSSTSGGTNRSTSIRIDSSGPSSSHLYLHYRRRVSTSPPTTAASPATADGANKKPTPLTSEALKAIENKPAQKTIEAPPQAASAKGPTSAKPAASVKAGSAEAASAKAASVKAVSVKEGSVKKDGGSQKVGRGKAGSGKK